MKSSQIIDVICVMFHLNEQHPPKNSFEMINHAFGKRLKVYKRNIRAKAADASCLWTVFEDFKALCKRIVVKESPLMKFNLCLFGIFEKLSPDESDHETEIFIMKSTHFVIKPYTKIKKIWSSIIANFDDRIDKHLLKGSGWVLTEVLKIHVEVAITNPLQYACQEPQFSPNLSTKTIPGQKHLINIQNSPYNCFITSIAFHYLKKWYPKMKKTLNDVSQHQSLYKNFIEGLHCRKKSTC